MARDFAARALAGKYARVHATAQENRTFGFGVGQDLDRGFAEIAAVDQQADAAQGVGTERRAGEPGVSGAVAGRGAFGEGGEARIEQGRIEQT